MESRESMYVNTKTPQICLIFAVCLPIWLNLACSDGSCALFALKHFAHRQLSRKNCTYTNMARIFFLFYSVVHFLRQMQIVNAELDVPRKLHCDL